MTSASPTLPALLHPHRSCDNGLYPEAGFYSQAQARLNHIVAFRRKPLFQMTVPLGTAGGTSGVAWRGYFRTGYGCKRVAVLALMAEDDRVVAVDPYLSVVLTEVGGAALAAQDFHYGASAVASVDDPDSLTPFVRFLSVTAATNYTLAATFNDNVRVVSLLVYEEEIRTVDDGNAYFSTYQPAAGSPIFDNRIGQQLEAVGNLLRYNSGCRVDWMRNDGTARTRVANTWLNLIDNSSASPPTAASPGFTLCTTARSTLGAPTVVRVKMAVYAAVTGGGSGTVRLRNTAGTDLVTVTVNSGTAGWFTNTGTVDVGSAVKVDIGFQSDGVNTLSVYAVSVYEEG